MEKTKCDECGKIIEGYTLNQANYMMKQHKLKHEYDRLKIKEEKEASK